MVRDIRHRIILYTIHLSELPPHSYVFIQTAVLSEHSEHTYMPVISGAEPSFYVYMITSRMWMVNVKG